MKKLILIIFVTSSFSVFANNPSSQFGDSNASHTVSNISHAGGK